MRRSSIIFSVGSRIFGLDRRGDHVLLGSPVPEIDQAAALAAERKIGHRRISPAFCRSDTSCVGEMLGTVPGVRQLGGDDGASISIEFADQIVIVRFGNADRRNCPGSGVAFTEIVDVADAVDLGRLRWHAALPEQSVSCDGPSTSTGNSRPTSLLVLGARDLLLNRHQPALAVVDGAAVDLAVEMKACRGVFVGVAEDAQPVELRGLDELAQLFEIVVGLAGKSDDEAGADRDAGNRARGSSRAA